MAVEYPLRPIRHRSPARPCETGDKDVDLQPIKVSGANVSALNGTQMKLMVAAATGLPETYFGDVSRGSLATAKTMDRPTELMIRERQTYWQETFTDIVLYVFRWAVQAPNGKLSGKGHQVDADKNVIWKSGVDAHLDIDFPPILERDIQTAVQAVVTALTLNGQQFALLDEPTATRLVLKALGEDDVDEIMSAIFGQTSSVTQGQAAVGEAAVVAAAKKVLAAIKEIKGNG